MANTGYSRLINHIVRVLVKHHYCAVPGLGSFMLRAQPARLDLAKGLLLPPTSSISFNESLQHDDASLAYSYREEYTISIRRATALMQHDVLELKKQLIDERLLQIGCLGVLELTQDGRLVYTPKQEELLPLYSLGLKKLPLAQHVASEKKTEYFLGKPFRAKNLSQLGLMGAAAVILILLFLFPPFRKEGADKPYAAGVSMEAFHTKAEKQLDRQTELATTKETTRDAVEPIAQETATAVYKGRFLVIIASSNNPKVIEQYIAEEQSIGMLQNLEVLSSSKSKMQRVVAERFSSETEAYNYIKQLAASSKRYQNAWVLHLP